MAEHTFVAVRDGVSSCSSLGRWEGNVQCIADKAEGEDCDGEGVAAVETVAV